MIIHFSKVCCGGKYARKQYNADAGASTTKNSQSERAGKECHSENGFKILRLRGEFKSLKFYFTKFSQMK